MKINATLRNAIKSSFSGIRFDDKKHEYTRNGVKFENVSAVVDRYQVPFEWGQYNEQARETGNRVHQFASQYPQTAIPSCEREAAVLEWFEYQKGQGLEFVGSEIVVYSDQLKIAGRVDLILYDPQTDKIKIIDWTTAEEINAPANCDLLAPFDDLPQDYLNIKALQISLYGVLLGLAGFGGCDMHLIALPKDGGFCHYRTEDLRRRIYDDLTK